MIWTCPFPPSRIFDGPVFRLRAAYSPAFPSRPNHDSGISGFRSLHGCGAAGGISPPFHTSISIFVMTRTILKRMMKILFRANFIKNESVCQWNSGMRIPTWCPAWNSENRNGRNSFPASGRMPYHPFGRSRSGSTAAGAQSLGISCPGSSPSFWMSFFSPGRANSGWPSRAVRPL